MNPARLLQLGFELGARALGGRSQGAWFATAPGGAPVVLKWSDDEAMADPQLAQKTFSSPLPALQPRSCSAPLITFNELGARRAEACMPVPVRCWHRVQWQ